MPDAPLVEIQFTPDFKRQVKRLAKRYRSIQADLQPIFKRLSNGESFGDQISGIDFFVVKVRVKNSDNRKGKSGGYRMIYWRLSDALVVLIDIYSKSDRSDVDVTEIRQIINRFGSTSEE